MSGDTGCSTMRNAYAGCTLQTNGDRRIKAPIRGGRAHSHSAKHKFKVRIAIYIFNILEMRVRNLKSSFEENPQII